MNETSEIDVLKRVIEDLTLLDSDARSRVVEYACKMLKIDRGHAPAPTRNANQQSLATGTPSPNKPIAPQQYLRNYNYKIMTKRIGVLAVYLERERGLKRFNFKDITDTFRNAKESKTPAQSQYSRAVIMGYLAKEGDQFYATSKAEELVDAYNARQEDNSGEEAQ